ncbi:thiol reductant ABC exporter subunit CydC [Arthrobacter sp. JSM 101049]|uniref:thiol reductant ABC exporter subunit CydC n=1 Tax=Arthrobacter sp. JSM 101049 TaxID=929097 RepID=UPI003565CF6C
MTTRTTTDRAPGPHRALRGIPRRQLAVLAGLSALKAVGLILLGQAVAAGIAVVASAGEPTAAAAGFEAGMLHLAGSLAPVLVGGCLGALLRSLSTWGLAYASQRVALGAKERLRHRLVTAVLTGRARTDAPDAPRGNGAVAALASRGLDGLDEYYTTFLPAVVGAAVVPVFIGARILAADWVSAVVLVCTVPLVPLFMALIGLHTRDRISRAAAGLDALSNQLAELAQGLPALVGLRRAAGRQRGLGAVSQRYRERTMDTLRTAFLSGFALELIATISVAVVAVFVGVRLVYGSLGLEVGLLALILAPEVFLPLRNVGAAFHASEDGVEALRRAEALSGDDTADAGPTAPADRPETGAVRVHGLRVRYPGAGRDVLRAAELELQPGGAAVLDTASGTGKTTWLKALAGLLPAGTAVEGSLVVPPATETAWIGQHPRFTEPTAARELAFHAPEATEAEIAAALREVNAAALRDRPLERLSPGEQRRVAVARGLLRVRRAGARLLLADEPTAHLDAVSAAAVRSTLAGLRGQVMLVVATHDATLAALLRGTENTLAADPDPEPESLEAQPGEPPSPEPPARGTADAPAAGDAARRPAAGARWRLLASIRWWRSGLGGGVLLAAGAVLSGAALTAVSGWLIVNASTRPPMMVLMVAIVGVRFFGLGRAALRYVQQLAVHRAVLDWATVLRTRLWDALSERPAGWGKLTRSGDALTHLVADVDELRDAAPRVLVPLPAAVLAWAGSLATAAWLVPSTLWVFAAAGVLGFGAGPWLALQVERGSAARAARHRSWIAGRLSVLLGAEADLRANGASDRAAGDFTRRDRAASSALLRAAAGTGLGEAVAALSAGLAAMACIGVVAGSGAAGADAAALLAVVALLGLSLQEPFANASDAAARLPLFRDRLDAVAEVLEPATSVAAPLHASPADSAAHAGGGASAGAGTLSGLELERVAVTWSGEAPVVADVTARVARGEWLAITGPSGSGKSSLLAVLLGLVRPSSGTLRLLPGDGTALDPWSDPAAAAPLLGRITWCPQEAHLFDSTVRNNLSLGRSGDDQATDAELRAAVSAVGLGSWFADQSDGLDSRIGSGGHRLSGGQRQRLAVARALVARAEVVLLDEPTAHLGQDEAAALVSDLRGALAGTAVVMVTHDPAMAAGADAVLDLAAGSRREALAV